ncbi:hypothetical protein [Candidatus Binatus sp.]|uniref:hypothetical protein n=1 Tax=Candidatus Binatus sp. TaxID=2811406 RepID=UPI003BB0CA08
MSLGLAAGILVAFNLIVRHVARNSVPRQLLRQIDAARGVTHLAVGNSLIFSDFDPSVFDASMAPQPVVAFNAGLGASGTVEQLMILQRALRGASTVKLVIYGFFDFQLTDPPSATLSDLIGNRAVAFYLDPGQALRSYQMNPSDRLEFEILRHVPMVVDRAGIWAKVERIRREMGEVGMPPVETNRFGRVADFALLEARSPAEFASQCELGQRAGLSQPVVEMIADAHARGAQVVIVEMPMHPYHQSHFYALGAWDKYREHLRKLVDAQHATYLNADDWIEDPNEFADHLHLTPSGAQDFSRRLAVKIREMDFKSDTAGDRPKSSSSPIAKSVSQ